MENTLPKNALNFVNDIKHWGEMLGFQQIGITDIDLSHYEPHFLAWLARKFHGKMHYMEKYGTTRFRPAELIPGTVRIISVRMNYLPPNTDSINVLANPHLAYVSRYTLGRDYHKLMRKRLAQLANKIKHQADTDGHVNCRVFTDSAPVAEKPLAEKAGLGWIGKHTNLIHRQAGSWFFIGEIFTDLPLPIDQITPKNHCGTCRTCITVCPTQAIVAPYQLDARRCISYLTIELREAIPVELRPLIGNRIYGCDDCQLFCPWNRFAKFTAEDAFHPRHRLEKATLLELFAWCEKDFLTYTEGSAIRRIGYDCWLRNIAVALGNAPADPLILQALLAKKDHPSELVREHVIWAIEQQTQASQTS